MDDRPNRRHKSCVFKFLVLWTGSQRGVLGDLASFSYLLGLIRVLFVFGIFVKL